MIKPIPGHKEEEIVFIFYDIVYFILVLIYLPFLVLRGKWHPGFWTRLGLKQLPFSSVHGKKVIWVHAVSVGEILAIIPFIYALREQFKQYLLVVSTVTKTGYALAQEKLEGICPVIYAPLDFSWAVRRYINTLNPVFYVSMETEIWPNLYAFLSREKIPIVQVNGRISDKAFEGYKKISFLMRQALNNVSIFCMQTDEDASRIIRLGADSKRVHVCGNLKFDFPPQQGSLDKIQLGFDKDVKLLVAGSTHPGEEEIIITAYKDLVKGIPDLRLIIAPRHIERAQEIIHLVQKRGFKPRRLSDLVTGQSPNTGISSFQPDRQGYPDFKELNVLIIDRIGYLRAIYNFADCVFVGKTLRGFGGQNMIEPLSFGKPTIVGPHTENFRDVVRIFQKTGGLIQVKDELELVKNIQQLFLDSSWSSIMAASVIDEIKKHQGATQRILKVICEEINVV